MSDDIQSDPPRPRKDWGDEAGDQPVQQRTEGLPIWAWLLIGLGAVSICAAPIVFAAFFLFLRASPSKVPPPPPVAPVPAPVPQPGE